MCDFLSAYSSLCAESASDSLAGSSFRRLIRMYRPCYRLIVSPPTSVMRSPHPIQSEVRRGCPEKKKDEVCAHAGVAKFADRASKMSTAFSFAAGRNVLKTVSRPSGIATAVAARSNSRVLAPRFAPWFLYTAF